MEFSLRCWHTVPRRLSQTLKARFRFLLLVSRLRRSHSHTSLKSLAPTALSPSTCGKSKFHSLGLLCSKVICRIHQPLNYSFVKS